MRSACLVVVLCLLASVAKAQATPAPGTCLGGSCTPGTRALADLPPPPRPSRGFAKAAAWFGLTSAALSLGGALAIAFTHEPAKEPITRGAWLGYTAVAVPLVALGSYTTRRRAKVPGYRRIRLLGWSGYAGALTNGTVQWYAALRDYHQPWGLTVATGVVSLFAFLPHALDAFLVSRQARTKGLAFMPTGDGFRIQF